MATLNWLATADRLSPAALTVRAQTLSPNDNGQLLWDIFFPRQDVDSVDLNDVTTIDERPVADRREWNGRGRYVPLQVPTTRKVSIIPVEAYDKIEEREMQKLAENTRNNEQVIRDIIGASLPQRADRLALADYRRMEVDAFTAWTAGTITQRNPQDASKTYTATFGFASARIATAGTAWNDSGVNAYDEFLEWYENGLDYVGPGAGAMLRLATYKEILADAPDLPNQVKMTRAELENRISSDLGQPFRFYVNEQSLDVFTDGGTAVTRTKVFPAQKVAYIPQGQAVGRMCFAPVVRAMEMSTIVPDGSIDVRGVTVFHELGNGGRELTIEAQVNALPVPDEQKVWVIDAGV